MSSSEDGWRPVGIYGTHLYALPVDLELEEIEDFPPDQAELLDQVASSSRSEDERQEEFERAAERFARKLERIDLNLEQIVVAIGKGERFAVASWQTFRETYEPDRGGWSGGQVEAHLEAMRPTIRRAHPPRVEAVAVPIKTLERVLEYLGRLEAAGAEGRARRLRQELEKLLQGRSA